MDLFDDLVVEVRERVATLSAVRRVASARSGAVAWPAGRRGAVVLQADTAVELGAPADASVAFLLCTTTPSLVCDGEVLHVGPDLGDSADSAGRRLPFGKVVLLEVHGFDEATRCERQRRLELLGLGLVLDGYMVRAVPRWGREWSRVSRAAVERGRSLVDLGLALHRLYRSQPEVAAAELVLVTSSAADVESLAPVAERAVRRLAALDRRSHEVEAQCDACPDAEACAEVEALRRQRGEQAGG